MLIPKDRLSYYHSQFKKWKNLMAKESVWKWIEAAVLADK